MVIKKYLKLYILGIMCVVINLEYIYQSFYDVLN